MNKLFLSLALLVVAPAFIFAAAPTAPVAAASVVDTKAVAAAALKAAEEAVVAAKAVADAAAKALADNKDTAQVDALTKASDAAKADLKAKQAVVSDLNPSYAASVLKFANGQVAGLRGLIERNPLVAVVTVVAFTAAAVESVHYLVASEDEEAQF